MKNIVLFSVLFICGIGYSQDMTNASTYMKYFSDESEVIQQDMWDYTRSVSHGRSARKVEKRRKELINSSNSALAKVEQSKDYNGSSEYKDAVIEFFRIVNIVLKEDYAKIVDMEAIAEQSYDNMETYMMARELASDKQSEAANNLANAQRKFAADYNVELIESVDPLDEKMEIAGDVYDHYNEIYLIFFKSNKQEGYLLDALSAGNLSEIEHNRKALISTVEEGVGKLENVELYSGDKSMVEATEVLFKFYEKEAEDIQLAIDYFLKMENFKKVKESFDQIKEKDRTQENVDQYNNAVNEMNAAIEAYNTKNDENNKLRSILIDGWNTAAEKFTNKHVPKGN